MSFSLTSLLRAIAICLLACGSLFSTAQAGYIYVSTDSANGNSVYGFWHNEVTGELTPLAGFPVSTGFVGAALTNLELATIDVPNRRLYVGNRGSSNVSVYSIDPGSGAITPLSFSPITTVANERTLKVHPSGSPLIIGADTFASFVITGTSATAAPGSPYAMPTGVSPAASAMSPTGDYYYAGGNSGNFFAGFAVNAATGELTTLAGSPFDSGSSNPVPIAVDSTGRLFVNSSRQALVRVYTLASGIPTAVPGSPFAGAQTGFASLGQIHPNGQFIAFANRTRGHVYSFTITGSAQTTGLTLVAGSPFLTSGTTSQAGFFNSAGTFYFVANGGTRNLTRFTVDPATGVLSAPEVQAANSMGVEGSISGVAYLPVELVTLGGKITDTSGRGVARAIVTLESTGQPTRTAVTNSFGNYRFQDVKAGASYTVSAVERRNTFQPQLVILNGARLDVDIQAQ